MYQSTHTGAQVDEAVDKALNPDTTPTQDSTALITSGGVKSALDNYQRVVILTVGAGKTITVTYGTIGTFAALIGTAGWGGQFCGLYYVMLYSTSGVEFKALSSASAVAIARTTTGFTVQNLGSGTMNVSITVLIDDQGKRTPTITSN